MPGRDPARWRLDAAGNVVCFRLRGCDGCLCHEYDHVVPHARGGRSLLSNCAVLQTRANRAKGAAAGLDAESLAGLSCAKRVWSDSELDMLEVALWGDVRRPRLACRVLSAFEAAAGARTPLPACPFETLYPFSFASYCRSPVYTGVEE